MSRQLRSYMASDLPGEFFPSTNLQTRASIFVNLFSILFRSERRLQVVFIPKKISTAKKVFIRNNSVSYLGPHDNIRRFEKSYVIDKNGRRDTISTERFNPAFSVDKDIFELNTHTCTPRGRNILALKRMKGVIAPLTAFHFSPSTSLAEGYI